MRYIITTKCSILYADIQGDEVRMQNEQGETLYTMDKEDFHKVYEIIGEEGKPYAGERKEERNTILEEDSSNR